MDFDRILTSAPINGAAARVTGRGVHHEVTVKPGDTMTWDAPPLSEKRPPGVPDYSGFRRGFMTAFRYHRAGGHGSQWLVRCDCGSYEVRSVKRWAEKAELPDACTRCRALHFVKNGVSFGFKP